MLRVLGMYNFDRELKFSASVWFRISWNLTKFSSFNSFRLFFFHFSICCLNELKSCEVSRNGKWNRCWKFQDSSFSNQQMSPWRCNFGIKDFVQYQKPDAYIFLNGLSVFFKIAGNKIRLQILLETWSDYPDRTLTCFSSLWVTLQIIVWSVEELTTILIKNHNCSYDLKRCGNRCHFVNLLSFASS